MVPKLDPFELKMERTTPICRKMAQSHCICSDGIRITTVHTVYEVYIISAASDVNKDLTCKAKAKDLSGKATTLELMLLIYVSFNTVKSLLYTG